jgi:hypothetical protein
VDRSPPPGPSEGTALVESDQQGAARSVPTTSRSHRIARVKRLRRVVWHRARSKPVGYEVDAFFFSLMFPKK